MQELATHAISPIALWILIAVVFGIWIAASWMFLYHWKTYAKNSRIIKRVMGIYFGISLLIFIIQAFLIVSL